MFTKKSLVLSNLNIFKAKNNQYYFKVIYIKYMNSFFSSIVDDSTANGSVVSTN